MTETCKHCQTEVSQHYCPNCGQARVLRRIDGLYLLQEIRSLFSFEKGLLYTIRELAVNPGDSVKTFLNEDRNRLVKPVVFLVVTSLVYTMCNSIFHFEDSYVKISAHEESAIVAIAKWVQSNYGYTNIIMAIFIGAWTKLFFRKHGVNIFEILILLCFVMGMGMLIYSVFGVMQSLLSVKLMQTAAIVGFIYLTWAIGQFFGKGHILNYLKAFFAYILGMLTFSVTAIMIGTLIDSLM